MGSCGGSARRKMEQDGGHDSARMHRTGHGVGQQGAKVRTWLEKQVLLVIAWSPLPRQATSGGANAGEYDIPLGHDAHRDDDLAHKQCLCLGHIKAPLFGSSEKRPLLTPSSHSSATPDKSSHYARYNSCNPLPRCIQRESNQRFSSEDPSGRM